MTMLPNAQHFFSWHYLFAAWIIAVVSTLGSLFLGEVMGVAPCNLCWYQRIFMFPIAIILGFACLDSDDKAWRHILPLAVIGWTFAAFHSLLYAGLIPEPLEPCGSGPSCIDPELELLGLLPIPWLALLAFSSIIFCLLLAARRSPK